MADAVEVLAEQEPRPTRLLLAVAMSLPAVVIFPTLQYKAILAAALTAEEGAVLDRKFVTKKSELAAMI